MRALIQPSGRSIQPSGRSIQDHLRRWWQTVDKTDWKIEAQLRSDRWCVTYTQNGAWRATVRIEDAVITTFLRRPFGDHDWSNSRESWTRVVGITAQTFCGPHSKYIVATCLLHPPSADIFRINSAGWETQGPQFPCVCPSRCRHNRPACWRRLENRVKTIIVWLQWGGLLIDVRRQVAQRAWELLGV